MNQPPASALPDDFFLGLFRVKIDPFALRFLGIALPLFGLTFCGTSACYAQSPSATSDLDVPDRNMIFFNDLKHDAVRMNASHAYYELAYSQEAVPIKQLEAALSSKDEQLRVLSLLILQHRKEYEPNQAMLKQCVDALADDDFPRNQERYINAYTAARSIPYLETWHRRAKPFLLQGLDSTDLQQRFLCAYILGRTGIQDRMDECIDILWLHTRDNKLFGDACMACSALSGFGPKVQARIRLKLDRENPDAQQKRASQLLFDHFDGNETDVTERRKLSGVSNPVKTFHLSGFYFPSSKKLIKQLKSK